MHIVVVGCGKVGSMLARTLDEEGHDVTVIDREEKNMALLGPDFSGMTVAGVPIDQDVLRKAGAETCDALAAVTPDDNTNIMVSQVAREFFKIKHVIARVYDPSREDVFSHFGLNTVCPTRLSVEAIRSILNNDNEERNFTLGISTISYSYRKAEKYYVGKKLRHILPVDDEFLFGVMDSNRIVHPSQLEPDFMVEENNIMVWAKLID